MSGIKEGQNLLEENIKLKRQQSEANEKFDELMKLIDQKMDKMISLLKDINEKEIGVTKIETVKNSDNMPETVTRSDDVPIFIPGADTDEMKITVKDISKKTRNTELTRSAAKLKQLQQSTEDK